MKQKINARGALTALVSWVFSLLLVLLVLLGVQELSLHAYWDNAVGLLTQFFYLPLLRLGAIVAMWTGQVFWFYFGAFLLLVLSSWLGCRAKDPVKK